MGRSAFAARSAGWCESGKMITSQEFIAIATSEKDYLKARNIILEYNADFSIYTCSRDLIQKIVHLKEQNNESELKELAALISEANLRERDIDTLLFEKSSNAAHQNALEDFFRAFEDPNTAERLFMLCGLTGVGKTTLIQRRFPGIITMQCHPGIDPYALFFYLADKGDGLKEHPTPLLKAIKAGQPIFLDDLNLLKSESLMALLGITDKKREIVIGDEVIVIAPRFRILAAFNPPSETDEREPMGDALLGRAIGIVVKMTDELCAERLNIDSNWIKLIRQIHGFVRNAGLIDIRDLNFRDFETFRKYGFETQFEFKMCCNDVSNIAEFEKIKQTGEYQNLLKAIKKFEQ